MFHRERERKSMMNTLHRGCFTVNLYAAGYYTKKHEKDSERCPRSHLSPWAAAYQSIAYFVKAWSFQSVSFKTAVIQRRQSGSIVWQNPYRHRVRLTLKNTISGMRHPRTPETPVFLCPVRQKESAQSVRKKSNARHLRLTNQSQPCTSPRYFLACSAISSLSSK